MAYSTYDLNPSDSWPRSTHQQRDPDVYEPANEIPRPNSASHPIHIPHPFRQNPNRSPSIPKNSNHPGSNSIATNQQQKSRSQQEVFFNLSGQCPIGGPPDPGSKMSHGRPLLTAKTRCNAATNVATHQAANSKSEAA
ncbi:hypothetical protein ACLOJK_018957 [Asimina triloba]